MSVCRSVVSLVQSQCLLEGAGVGVGAHFCEAASLRPYVYIAAVCMGSLLISNVRRNVLVNRSKSLPFQSALFSELVGTLERIPCCVHFSVSSSGPLNLTDVDLCMCCLILGIALCRVRGCFTNHQRVCLVALFFVLGVASKFHEIMPYRP